MYRMICFTTQCDTMCDTEWYVCVTVWYVYSSMYRMICFTTQCDTMCNIVQCTEWYVSQHSVILCVI